MYQCPVCKRRITDEEFNLYENRYRCLCGQEIKDYKKIKDK